MTSEPRKPRPKHPGTTWRRLIFEARLTQGEVAERIGITGTHMSRIINGHRLPGPQTTARFAAVVDGNADKLWAQVAAYRLAQTRGCPGG